MKRAIRVILYLLLGFILINAIVYVRYKQTIFSLFSFRDTSDIKFERDLWIRGSITSKDKKLENIRMRMFHDLQGKYSLIGMNMPEITNLLGSPNNFFSSKHAKKPQIDYYLEPTLGDSKWLIIYFTTNNVATSWEIIED